MILIAHAGDVSRNRRLLSDDQIEALISEGLDGWRYGTVAIHRSNENGCSPSAAGTSCWSPVGLTGMAKANRTNWGENLTDEATVEEIVHRGVLPLYR